ncbi:AfsR/SARP family transcriptional regulator [Kitasatospora viridis]|uniref:DNA-binding SARP family transcriptional activator n=1 Tax=Kitasatospora viridis TaxID=281105 RepID=A0A561SE31_9ACTN|nr:BTAD domain-containing putative transcriptional regulator [Kitasatospora viridis]TWF73126.1 DNA-binding SARP family transcriptional activator [Kitasatospora viridis]
MTVLAAPPVGPATAAPPVHPAAPATAAGLSFQLLGPLAAWHDGQCLALGRKQQQAFLAMLLANRGRSLTAAQLADGIFEEGDPPGKPKTLLATHAYRLRAELKQYSAAHLLVTAGGGYRLDVPPQAVDQVEFDRLTATADQARAAGEPARARELLDRALALHRGEPLAGLPGPHAADLRRHLVERRLDALEAKLAIDVELGDNPHCLVELDQAVFANPYRERFRSLLMLEYQLTGQPAMAGAVHADARAFYRAEGLSCTGLDELAARIRRADPSLARAGGPGADRPAPAPVPRQLPPAAADFTGRDTTVAQLVDRLSRPDPGTVVISAVNGIGGVGKTALAVHAAHRLRDGFPDGQLHVDLRGAEPEPLDPVRVLGDFLTALGVEERAVPQDPVERAALYRTTVTGRRLLILLDNAATAEQVRPLLPGAETCAVLVTSRAWLTGLPAADHLHLEPLDPASAVELLGRIVGRRRVEAEPEAAAALVAACGLLPLAVRIAASRLAADPGLPLAELAARLADRQRAMTELVWADSAVAAVFALSYAQLGSAQARAFRLLALPDTADLDLSAAAALLGCAPARARELLEGLADLNLLESRAADRYGFHDLLREFARDRGRREDDAAAVGAAFARLLDFCLATARNAEERAHSVDRDRRSLITVGTTSPGRDFETVEAASAWMRAQTGLHRAVVRRACQDAGLPLAQAADLVDKMGSILFGRGYLTTVAELAGQVAEVAPARADRPAEALARSVRGSMLWHANDWAGAGAELARCLPLCDGAQLRLRANVLQLLGANARALSRFEEAIEPLEEAVGLFHRLRDETAEGLALGELAFNYAQCGRTGPAGEAAARCVELTGRQISSISSAVGQYYLARVRYLCGDLGPAERAAEQVLERFRSFGMTGFEVATRSLIAHVQLAAGQPTACVRTTEAALPRARQMGGVLEGGLLRVLGRALGRIGHADRARTCLAGALELFRGLEMAADVREVEELLRDPALLGG